MKHSFSASLTKINQAKKHILELESEISAFIASNPATFEVTTTNTDGRIGFATPPPELAGRDHAIEQAAVALDRIREGRAARSIIFYGLRGVGKTVLLNRIRVDAEARGIVAVRMEAPEERSLPALLAPSLRAALIRLDRGEAVKAGGRKALSALAGFISSLKVKFQDIELGMDVDPERGLADSGDLDNDLEDLIAAVGEAAGERKTVRHHNARRPDPCGGDHPRSARAGQGACTAATDVRRPGRSGLLNSPPSTSSPDVRAGAFVWARRTP
jgi:AAA ATPase domain